MVSVIVPIYNTEKYLTKCLNSIQNQTYSELEIIMIDDGSVDSSCTIARTFEKCDNRFHYYFQKNAGVSSARNRGIELAKGEFLLFIDSDDWIEPNMIGILVRNMVEHCADISCCQYDHGTSFSDISTVVWNQDKVLQEFLIHKQINGSLVNKLFKREMLGDVRLDESIKYGEDALFLWKNLLTVNSVVISNKVLYHVTLHDDSASGGGSYKPIRRDCIRVWEEISRDAGKLGQPYADMAKSQLCNMAFFSFYEMAYYGYDNKEDEILFKKVLEQNYGSLINCEFVSKGVKVLSLFTIKMGLLSKIMIRFKSRWRNEW